MMLHSKLHLTFIYTFIPRFYSIACLSKLRSIITSLALLQLLLIVSYYFLRNKFCVHIKIVFF